MPAGFDNASSPDDKISHSRREMATSSKTSAPIAHALSSIPDAAAPSPSSATYSRSQVDRNSPEYMIKSGIAGGLAGCAAKTLVGPLDRVKILFQTSNPQFQKYTGSWSGFVQAMNSIYKSNGVRGLFRGHSATLLRIFPYAGIKFFAYEQIRGIIIHDKAQETSIRRFMSGSLAGLASVFCTYPLEVIRVRLAFETRDNARASLIQICKRIYHEHPPRVGVNTPSAASAASATVQALKAVPSNPGAAIPRAASQAAAATASTIQELVPRSGIANFYRGFTPTVWGMLPYAGASFLTHDSVRDVLRYPALAPYTTLPGTGRGDKPAQLVTWAQLVAGGLAGFVSQTVSYPLEVIRRRMQVGGAVGDGRRLGMVEVGSKILSEKGWRGFFVGLSIGYVKVVPMAATSFYVYERGKYYLGI